MRLHNPFTEADLVDLNTDVDSELILAGQHIVTVCLSQFGYDDVLPKFKPAQARDDRAKAFAHLSYRLLGMLRAAARLEEPATIQALAGVARSVFEIATDIALLSGGHVSAAVEKFHEFTAAERLRAARVMVNVYKEGGWDPSEIEDQVRYTSDAGRVARIEASVERLWGRRRDQQLNWPRHWSGEESAGRARLLGVEWSKTNHRLSHYLAWQVHGGAVGAVGLDHEGMQGMLMLIREVFSTFACDAFRNLAAEFGFCGDVFLSDLRFMQDTLGTVVVIDLKRQRAGHPSRLGDMGIRL